MITREAKIFSLKVSLISCAAVPVFVIFHTELDRRSCRASHFLDQDTGGKKGKTILDRSLQY